MVQKCAVCQSVKNQPAVAPLHPWPWPTRIWQRIHIDFAEKYGVNYLIDILLGQLSHGWDITPICRTSAKMTTTFFRV